MFLCLVGMRAIAAIPTAAVVIPATAAVVLVDFPERLRRVLVPVVALGFLAGVPTDVSRLLSVRERSVLGLVFVLVGMVRLSVVFL